jgi:hypothetical protein
VSRENWPSHEVVQVEEEERVEAADALLLAGLSDIADS